MSDLVEFPEALPAPLYQRKNPLNPQADIVTMESGRTRARRKMLDAFEVLQVTWNFTVDQFEVFEEWFRVSLEQGSLHFSLVTHDSVTQTNWEMAFVEAKYSFVRNDNLFTVSATVEVFPNGTTTEPWIDPDALPPELKVRYPTGDGESTENPDDSCREELWFDFDDLDRESVYVLETSQSKGGTYSTLCFFMFKIGGDLSTGIKTVKVNNVYNQPGEGAVWFRASCYASLSVPPGAITQPVLPMPSEIPPPIVTLVGEDLVVDGVHKKNPSRVIEGGDIPGHQLSNPDNPTNYSITPLEFYRYGTKPWDLPLSYLEQPYLFDSEVYQAVSNKYAIRHWDAVSIGQLNDRLPYPTEHQHEIMMEGSGDGVEYRWTRDRSDPTIDTVMPVRNGMVNNADITDPAFPGVIKVRAFKGECRSPLTTVIVDTIWYELPNIVLLVRSGAAAAGCDLPKGDVESGQSCNLYYGGPEEFDHILQAQVYASMINTGVPEVESQGAPLLLNQLATFTQEFVDYLDWTEHVSFVSGVRARATWRRPLLWKNLPTHTIGDQKRGAYSRANVTFMLEGSTTPHKFVYPKDDELETTYATGETGAIADLDTKVNASASAFFGEPPDNLIPVTLTQFDVTQSPLPHTEPRMTYWVPILLNLQPPEDVPPPAPYEPEVDVKDETYNDNFESYQDGSMIDVTLAHNNSVGNPIFFGPWYVTKYEFDSAREDFERYTVGSMTRTVFDSTTNSYVTVSLNYGEGWEPGSKWIITDYASKIETFDSYSVGSMNYLPVRTGQGFVGPWIVSRSGFGAETFEGFSVGAFTSATPNPQVTGFAGTWVVS